MSVDALALLRIEKLAAPRSELGIEEYVAHYGDASVISTFRRFDARVPDELALALRQKLGATLDPHDDARGILFFPDVCEFHGATYDAIVREVERAGCWAPKVDADHVPIRYTNAAPGTHDALLGQMIARMGRDAVVQFDLIAQVNAHHRMTNATPDADATYRAHLDPLVSTLGSEFVTRYETSVENEVQKALAEQRTRFDGISEMQTRTAGGEPLISATEFIAFLDSGAGAAALGSLDPALLAALEVQFEGVDPETLPDDDLGKALLGALRRTKR